MRSLKRFNAWLHTPTGDRFGAALWGLLGAVGLVMGVAYLYVGVRDPGEVTSVRFGLGLAIFGLATTFIFRALDTLERADQAGRRSPETDEPADGEHPHTDEANG